MSRYSVDSDSNAAVGKAHEFLKANMTDADAYSKILEKYGDSREAVNEVFNAYKKRLTQITEKANKFKNLILNRFSTLEFEELVEKAKERAVKYGITDDEFDLFLNLALTQPAYKGLYDIPASKLSATLGYDPRLSVSDRLSVRDDEIDVLREILKLTDETKSLHYHIVLQHLRYSPFNSLLLSGKFDPKKNSLYSHVHPVIAAMFCHKIDLFEEQMLIANIGNMIKTKNEGKPIASKPEWELYWNLISDPNEAVCDVSSPLKDLHNRFVLQTHIWDQVQNLREGHFYKPNLGQFIVAIDACKSNLYEAPDMFQVRDEGTIMRRILSAFSLRPTMVSTHSLHSPAPASYGGHTAMIGPVAQNRITKVSMINLRIPESNMYGMGSAPVSLEEALNQPQWFIENKQFVPKTHSVISSNDVVVFYVNRRNQTVDPRMMGKPFEMARLPLTISGAERVNKTEIIAGDAMHIGNEVYTLASVVYVVTQLIDATMAGCVGTESEIIVGQATYLIGENGKEYVYSPLDATQFDYNVITELINPEDKHRIVSQTGSIYIYKKVSSSNSNCVRLFGPAP